MEVLEVEQQEIDRIYMRHVSEGCFMPQAEWEPLVRQAYSELVHHAINAPYDRITITYAQLGTRVGLVPVSDWFNLKIAWILYACATLAHNHGLPLITALVVNSETKKPGKGFWGLDGIPQELYRVSSRQDDVAPFILDSKRDTFWVEELKQIDRWGKSLQCSGLDLI